MATKMQVKTFEEEISTLQYQLKIRDDEIIRLSQQNVNLIIQIEQTQSLNNYLTEERNRLTRAETINKNLNIDLMHAIAVLGHRESNRINSEVWHECLPQNQNVAQLVTSDDSQKT